MDDLVYLTQSVLTKSRSQHALEMEEQPPHISHKISTL